MNNSKRLRRKDGRRKAAVGLLFGALPAAMVFCSCSSPDEALLKQYRSYYHGLPEEHPARFAVNQTAEKTPSASYFLQCGSGDREAARAQIRKEIAWIETGIRWKEKRKTVTLKIGGPPIVFSGEYPLNSTRRESPESQWSIRCDEEKIIAAADFPDPVCLPNDRSLYRGDALEIFLCTNYDAKLYREIIVNPNGTVFTALHVNHRFGSFLCLVPDGKEKFGIAVQAEQRGNGFRLETAIPWRSLPEYTHGNSPRAGDIFYFMLVRTNCNHPGGEALMTTPVPLLYSPHNVFGYIRAELQE